MITNNIDRQIRTFHEQNNMGCILNTTLKLKIKDFLYENNISIYSTITSLKLLVWTVHQADGVIKRDAKS